MNKTLAKVNFDYCSETIKLKGDLELSYLDIAQRLHKIQLNKMYQPNYETFDEFLQEIKISRASAYKLITIWVRFVIQFKLQPKLLAEAGGWSVVSEVLPYSETKTSAIKWLRSAKELTRSDLRKVLTEQKTGIDMMKCKHKNVEVITFEKCLVCGETKRIYPDEKIK